MKLYLIHVSGLIHHVTSHPERHWAYAADLRAAGHDVTTEERA
ncbi:hypothetical protein PP358_gp63 [Arthrobacter phage Shoya]|uniref:Uncharacterized protein n=1 Tax=Arthrobacter phage Shoya TaxID=2704035 RepID=A0A6G6XI94_9CAUD|nr:hypothetical protein PP358_gp63 [Arthrobacter phage Shoya]QIG57734.1 hypothetical protein SEA_SHOYA_63 [Arthrobacter phage Shoya]